MSTTTTDIPEYLRPYSQELLAKADALTSTPYQSYGGERVAQFTPLQKGAFGRAGNQQVAGQIGTGTGLASLAGASSFTNPGTSSQFMSPYMQNVVAMQQRDAQRQADIAGTQRGYQAVRAGGFGGSRQAIMDSEAQRNLSQQLGDIQTTGLQSAFESGQKQFNQEQTNRLNAAQQLGQLGQYQFGQEMDITGQQAQFGGQQRQATQDILNTQYQDFLNKQRAPYDQLSFMSGIFRGTPMGQTTTTTDPKASSTSQLIGLGTTAAGLYGSYLDNQNRTSSTTTPRVPTAVGAAGGSVRSYAAGGIADLNAMADGMSDQQLQQVVESPTRPEFEKMPFAAQQQENDALRRQTEAMRAKGNVGNITSTLARMPDSQLQQYAQLNKSDPYVMALVVAESKRRKEGGMPSQEAPTVVDQQIAGMALPEEMGIAQLPVGNMQFANGGIIAFAQGDEVLSTEEQLERQRAEDRARIKSAFESGLISAEEFGRAIADIGTLPVRGVAGALDTAVIRPLRAAGADIGYMSPYLVPDGVDPVSMTPFSDQMRSGTTDRSGIAALEAPPASAAQGRGVGFTDPRLSQSGVNQSVAALRSAETQRKNVADAGAGGEKQPGPPGIPSGLNYLRELETERDRQIAAQAEIDKLRAADVAATRGELSEEEKLAREFGAEREKRLKAQEEKLAGSEKQNFNMTLVEMGLAMMAGKSPDALQNLATGAQQGLKGYQGRLKSIQDGREKLDESMSRLAEIREEKLSAVGARKRELNGMERSILTESRAAQEKIASAFAGDKIKFTKDQADKANDRAFDMWKFKQREVTGSRTDAANLRVALSGQITALQRKRDQGEGLSEDETQQLSQLQREFSGLTTMLSNRLGLQGSGTVGGSSTLPAGFKLD